MKSEKCTYEASVRIEALPGGFIIIRQDGSRIILNTFTEVVRELALRFDLLRLVTSKVEVKELEK